MVESSCSAAGHNLRITDHLHFLMARILVIRGGAIGDFILTLPAIRLLREAFPAAHLELLGHKHIVALAERRFMPMRRGRSIRTARRILFAQRGSSWWNTSRVFSRSSATSRSGSNFENNLRRAGAKTSFRPGPGSTTTNTWRGGRVRCKSRIVLEQPAPTLF
jgi:hypothetical protein